MDRVCIIGLGLMGGSLARDLAALGVAVTGYDQDATTLAAARAEGVIAQVLDPSLDRALDQDIVVIATRVSRIPIVLSQLGGQSGPSLITDVGSTKRAVLAAAQAAGLGERFVGSHPLAGDHRSGWSATRCGLFAGALTYLCPTSSTAPRTTQAISQLWQSVGARTEVIEAAAHDELLAWTSHLPQALASALMASLLAAGIGRERLGPGGRDMTRLAASDPKLWTDILLANRDLLDQPVAELTRSLTELRHALQSGDEKYVEEFLRRGGPER